MGAKTALLAYTTGDPADLLRMPPPPDPGKTSALVAATHPGWTGTRRVAGGSLADHICPPEGSVYAGSFPGTDVLCDEQVNPLPFHPLDLGEATLRQPMGFVMAGRPTGADISAENVELLKFAVTPPDPVTRANVEEFIRTHKRTRYTLGPRGSLIPVKE